MAPGVDSITQLQEMQENQISYNILFICVQLSSVKWSLPRAEILVNLLAVYVFSKILLEYKDCTFDGLTIKF